MAAVDFPSPDFPEVRDETRRIHSEYLDVLKQQATSQLAREAVEAEHGSIDETIEAIKKESEEATDALRAQIVELEEEISAVKNGAPPPGSAAADAAAGSPSATATATAQAASGGPQNAAEAPLAAATDVPPEQLDGPGLLKPETRERLEKIATRTRATTDRKWAESIRAKTGARRRLVSAGILVVAVLSGVGIGGYVAPVIFKHWVSRGMPALKFIFAEPVLMFLGALVYGAFAWLFATHVAAALQAYMISKREPRKTTYINAIARIFEVEVYGGPPKTDAEKAELDATLAALQSEAVDGQDPADAALNLKLHGLIFGFIAACGAAANFGFFQKSLGGNYPVAVLLSAFILGTLIGMAYLGSRYAHDWPKLPEKIMDPSDAQALLAKHNTRIEQIRRDHANTQAKAVEAKALAAEAQAKAREQSSLDAKVAQLEKGIAHLKMKIDEVANERDAKIAGVRATYDRKVEKHLTSLKTSIQNQTKAKLAALRNTIEDYEAHRGYSQSEQKVLRARLMRARLLFFCILLPFSAVTGLVATYPASISAWDFLQQRFMYIYGFRFAPIMWLGFIGLVVVAEWVIVNGQHIRETAIEKAHTLHNHYAEKLRLNGLLYDIATSDEEVAAKQRGNRFIIIGIAALCIETAFNFRFMLQTQASDRMMAGLLAFVPLVFFVLLTLLHANVHHRIAALKNAVDWASTLHSYPRRKKIASADPGGLDLDGFESQHIEKHGGIR